MQTLIAPSANFSPVNLHVPSATKSEEGAWGHRMAAYLRPDEAHPIQVQTLRKARMVVTRLRCNTGLSEISAPVPYEKAFVVALQLRESPFHELWLDDRPVAVGRYPERSVSILDLEQRPSMLLPNPFDSIHFHLTRTALDEISDDYGASRISSLSWPHGEIDPVTNHLGLTILPALENPKHTSMLFLDHAVFALKTHFAQTYGGMRAPSMACRGGLAPWQERRSKDLMNERIESDVSLVELANECRLSRSHFARAFKKTTGQSPHVWLMQRRIQNAKRLLTESESAISDIALACGFSDQSHLTKVFSKLTGAPPGAWRRAVKC